MSRTFTTALALFLILVGLVAGLLLGLFSLYLLAAFLPLFFLRRWWVLFPIFVLALFLGIIRGATFPQEAGQADVTHLVNGQQQTLVGQVVTLPDRRFTTDRFVLSVTEIDNQQTIGKVLILSPIKRDDIRFGDVLEVTGRLQHPERIDDFAYDRYLARNRIYTIMHFPKVTSLGHVDSPLDSLYQLRFWFATQLHRYLPSPSSAFALGLLIGDKSGFSVAWEESFRVTGLSHILALSG